MKDAWSNYAAKEAGAEYDHVLAVFGEKVQQQLLKYANDPPQSDRQGIGSGLRKLFSFWRRSNAPSETKNFKHYINLLDLLRAQDRSDRADLVWFIWVLGNAAEYDERSIHGKLLYEALVKSNEDRDMLSSFIDGMIQKSEETYQSKEEQDFFVVALLWAKQKILGQTLGANDADAAAKLIASVKREQIFSRTYRIVLEGADR